VLDFRGCADRIGDANPLTKEHSMAEFRPYADLPKGVNPLIQSLIDKHYEVTAMAILPGGEESLKVAHGVLEKQFNDFKWAQFVFCDLEKREGIRGFICANKVFLVWPDQITLAAGGEAVF
jgi:hypothetical protein